MTEITVFLKGGKPIGFDAHGHTGYAECGEDIVCAAVSAITQTQAYTAETFTAEDGMTDLPAELVPK